jgi:hypothetical protein
MLVHTAGRDVRAAPQITTRTELEWSTFGTMLAGSSPIILSIGAVHFDMRLSSGTSALVLRLDPGVLAGPAALSSSGLTEAYVERRSPRFDLQVGVERLPLETARLAVPFLIEPVDNLGTRQGLLGARLNWYPDRATRLRVALLDDAGRVHPAASLRRAFGSFEVEAHALGFGVGRTALGVGASGLAHNLVVYGEVWALTAPSDTRYAAGISGSIPDGLWTVEISRGQALVGALARLQLAEAPVRLQLAGQVVRRFGEDFTVTGTASVFSTPDPYRALATVELTKTAGDATYTLALGAVVGPQPVQGVIATSIRLAF